MRCREDLKRSRPDRALESLRGEEADEPGDEDKVQGEAKAPVDQRSDRFERQEGERGKNRQRDGEEHDVAALRAAHGEEFRVSREQVEDRLREREGAEGRELGTCRQQLAQ